VIIQGLFSIVSNDHLDAYASLLNNFFYCSYSIKALEFINTHEILLNIFIMDI